MKEREGKDPMWSGTVVYGAVRVPVRLYRAQPTERPTVPLKTLHRECMAPINRVERCSECAAELRPEDKLQAYEVSRGEYVPVAREELPRAEAAERNAVDVEDWIPLAHLDPMQLDRTYYLAGAEGTERTYALLHRAMLQTGAAMIARITLRTRESVCAIYPRGAHLVLSTLHVAAELTDLADIPAGADGVPVEERAFVDLVSTIMRHTVPMNPFRYTDRQTDAAMEVIREKIAEQASITKLPRRGKRVA
jgi:DNA end-binding protein Ku